MSETSTAKSTLSRKAAAAVVIGNWLEFYDFLVFTYFAVMIAQAFFPGESDTVKLLAALATFGAGFLTRPLGAAIIGAYADRAGRRAALTLTILLMALGSGLVGLTPGYAQIGVAAPIILVIARLIQGFSCGGEMGPATTYLLESARPAQRAGLTAWQGYSQQFAAITGSLIGVILSLSLSTQDLYAWGWRIPFLVGILIAPVGLYIRRQLPETISAEETHASARAVLSDLVRHHSRAVVLGMLVMCGATVSVYVFNYMTTYAITTLHLSATIGTTITLAGAAVAIVGIAAGVWLDRFGRKRTLVLTRVVFVVVLYPGYLLMTSPQATPASIIAVNMFLVFVFSLGVGALYAFLPEAFPKAVRSSGLSILYALGVAIFGGTTQVAVAWLIHVTGDPLVPAWYQIVANVVSIGAILLLVPHEEVVREQQDQLAGELMPGG